MKKKNVKYLEFFDLFIILFAFVFGNLFVIQNSQLNWNIPFILVIVLGLEFINKTLYCFAQQNFLKSKLIWDKNKDKKFYDTTPKKYIKKTKFGFFESTIFWQINQMTFPAKTMVGFKKTIFFVFLKSVFIRVQIVAENFRKNFSMFFYIGLTLNTLKRGFLLGFFLEAFKVGS
jgi:hypothetical protein